MHEDSSMMKPGSLALNCVWTEIQPTSMDFPDFEEQAHKGLEPIQGGLLGYGHEWRKMRFHLDSIHGSLSLPQWTAIYLVAHWIGGTP